MLPEPPAEPVPDLGPFTRATVVVPDWGPGVPCPTGRVTFPNGQHAPSHGRVLNLMSVVTSDVDRDGVEDYVAEILCGEGPESPGWQVVAFRRSGDTLVPIGRVIGSQDGFAMMSGLKAVTKDRIAVNVSNQYTDSGEQYVPHQWRTYAWQAGRFSQVDGPTSFPANPPAARLSVDPAELYFRPAQDGRYVGDLTVTARNSGDAAVANAVLTFFLPFEVRPAGGAWSDCTMLAQSSHSRRSGSTARSVGWPRRPPRWPHSSSWPSTDRGCWVPSSPTRSNRPTTTSASSNGRRTHFGIPHHRSGHPDRPARLARRSPSAGRPCGRPPCGRGTRSPPPGCRSRCRRSAWTGSWTDPP